MLLYQKATGYKKAIRKKLAVTRTLHECYRQEILYYLQVQHTKCTFMEFRVLLLLLFTPPLLLLFSIEFCIIILDVMDNSNGSDCCSCMSIVSYNYSSSYCKYYFPLSSSLYLTSRFAATRQRLALLCSVRSQKSKC